MHWLPWMQHSDLRNKLTMLTGTWSQNTGPNLQRKRAALTTLKCEISSRLDMGRELEGIGAKSKTKGKVTLCAKYSVGQS